jgi:hypothetical protein
VCNYHFEYDSMGAGPAPRERRASRRGGGGDADAGIVVVCALFAGVVTMFLTVGRLRSPGQTVSPGIGVFCIAAGAFSILGAAMGWSWFLGARKARLFVALLGRTGARCFYGLLGGGLAGLGVSLLLATPAT